MERPCILEKALDNPFRACDSRNRVGRSCTLSPPQDGLFSVPASLYGFPPGSEVFLSTSAMTFELQGHRGARGLRPENTLSSFEAALDCLANAIETDLHLTRDGIPVLVHDPYLEPVLFRLDGQPSPRAAVHELELAALRRYRGVGNPDPARFPDQVLGPAPAAELFAAALGFDPYTPPTLDELFGFVAAYAGALGAQAGKTSEQRTAAGSLHFDLELKRVPAHPEYCGRDFDGQQPGQLERAVAAAVCAAGLVKRTTIRSFDHRAVRAIRSLEPGLTGAVLIADTAPADPAHLVRAADAHLYAPDHRFLDQRQVEQCHAAGYRVIPWTVNTAADWARMLACGVDGMTTDYPDRLSDFLTECDFVRK